MRIKELKTIVGMMLLFHLSVVSTEVALGNNIRITGRPSVQVSGGALEVSFRLSWDNAWRDEFNWDAAWVFVKWKRDGAAGGWNALPLSPAGHEAGDAGSGLTCQAEGTAGAFIYWSGASARDVTEQTVRLKAPLPSGVSADDVANRKLYISVFATEIVLVPYGAFYAGDGASASSFSDVAGQPYLVNSESITNVYALSPNGGAPVSLFSSAPSFPKGYKGFYAMKYEVSQEQYVHYLNTLSYAEQKARIGNSLDALQVGDYIFGDPKRPSCRNGIAVFSKENTTSPAVFGCNLNPNDPFSASGDGQTIACNYLTSSDLEAYCSWSGLRAMSELEYEKLSRPVGQMPVARSYAWSSTGLSPFTGDAQFVGGTAGTEQEHFTAEGLNANARNAFGPVRCGSFGGASSSQEQAGAGFYGAMELSGNVSELCLKATSGYCLRGGSFASPDSLLCTSNRSVLTAPATRDSTVGFRAVRTVTSVIPGSGSLTVTGGVTATSVCQGATATVTGPAVTVPDGLNVQYSWYVNDILVPGASEETLNYSGFEIKKSYVFKRKAICPLGEAEHSSSSITVVLPSILAGSIETIGNKTIVCLGDNLLIRNKTNASYGGSCPFDSVITYSWYVNNTLLPNQSGDTLLYSAFVSGTNYVFKRRATSVVGASDAVSSTITVLQPVTITTQPISRATCSLSLSVVASGTAPLTYQWQRDGVNLSGATTATYTKSATSSTDVGSYVCVVSNGCGSVTSSVAQITVLQPVTITTQPASQNGTCNLSLSVVASGTAPITYQWQKDGGDISGATAATYTKSNDFSADLGSYVCVVSNSCGNVVSRVAQVTFIPGKTGVLTDTRDRKTYNTRILGDGREWMIEDLRFGNCLASDYTGANSTGNVSGKIGSGLYGVCRPNTQSGAGHLYNWQAAMQRSDAYYGNGTIPSGRIRGICPSGWHLPSSSEFLQLYTALCSKLDRINPGTNDWQGVLGGACDNLGSLYSQGSRGLYWSSTGYSSYYSYYLSFYSGTVDPQYDGGIKSYGCSVRCLKDY